MELTIKPDFDSDNVITITDDEVEITLEINFIAFRKAEIKINNVSVGYIIDGKNFMVD